MVTVAKMKIPHLHIPMIIPVKLFTIGSKKMSLTLMITLMIIMTTATILKNSDRKCTTTHSNDHSCDVSLQIFVNINGYHGNGGQFETVKP